MLEPSMPQTSTGERWSWAYPAPPRWLLWDEYSDGGERAVAVCHDIDGLFADSPPPAYERLTLLGCRPEGPLAAALHGDPWLGDLVLEPVDHQHPAKYGDRVTPPYCCAAYLCDVTVTGARPSAAGGGLLDVDLSGVVDRRDEEPPADRPTGTGFRLTHRETPLGVCQDVAGVHRARPDLSSAPVTLVGCRPEPPLRDALAALARPGAAARRRRITATVRAVKADGTTVSAVSTGLFASVTGVRPSAVGDGLLDVTFDGGIGDPFPTGARQIWDRWYAGRPAEPGEWTGYDRALRHEWAGAALAHHGFGLPDRPAGRTYHLDGRFVTDVEGFYCAIGEAVNGPGGYFGWNLDALVDCLRGRWGAETPLSLVWHDSAVARQHLMPGYDRHRWGLAITFDYLLGLLAEHRVRVELR
ncbi:barstar family protein [Catellatospora coxensis]|uniref:Barstar (barnase inhibitor) domain-containing protein n=1 Tax=Catellatospora coxensis TaxID=310354 RepID=A0A8J3KYW9_9ACTN|nr:barstar family protein [Catellatospora coxensis]GIG11288.1 hypothetical protein Cco03nite_79880 [Catellatospora coxensis]